MENSSPVTNEVAKSVARLAVIEYLCGIMAKIVIFSCLVFSGVLWLIGQDVTAVAEATVAAAELESNKIQADLNENIRLAKGVRAETANVLSEVSQYELREAFYAAALQRANDAVTVTRINQK
jgi:hypothetical protein